MGHILCSEPSNKPPGFWLVAGLIHSHAQASTFPRWADKYAFLAVCLRQGFILVVAVVVV